LRIAARSLQAKNILLRPIPSGCGRSTPEEMRKEHHDADYQQHMNYAAGNVKCQESKQPKNNQNCCDYSQHFFNSFTCERSRQ
jgi:hypothetical protein